MLSHQAKLKQFHRKFENGYDGEYIVSEWIAPDWIKFKVILVYSTTTLSSNQNTSDSKSIRSICSDCKTSKYFSSISKTTICSSNRHHIKITWLQLGSKHYYQSAIATVIITNPLTLYASIFSLCSMSCKLKELAGAIGCSGDGFVKLKVMTTSMRISMSSIPTKSNQLKRKESAF
ncbi:UNKNOWN [Stylonychia lemnae]|uniref:Uncharacterized protein n=1 Tax=Stylonychia lemnae TaxID=5949 RepID=A0A078A3K4_STYLE|nr:UNKNOWN [Stylonychia lemnae]|eukprot:CDW75319.1 UNKNOWN [Stylonychia lemnae]